MIALKSFAIIAALVVAGIGATVAATRVHTVEHWALYAASGKGHPYHLFLDPFPNSEACESDAKQIRGAGGLAYCKSHSELSFNSDRDAQLVFEFLGPESPWGKLCKELAQAKTRHAR
jgi:hypothetical protein